MHARIVVRHIVPMVLTTRVLTRATVEMRVVVHIVSHVRAGNPDLQRVENTWSITSQFAWEQVVQISESVKSGFPARRYRAAESGDSVLAAARAIMIARTVVPIVMATRLLMRGC